MKSSKNERVQKAVAASNAPRQVVSRPVPALGMFIAAAHQSAINTTNVDKAKIPVPNTSPLLIRHNENQPKAMDAKFPVASRAVTPEKTSRVTLKTPEEYSGSLEKKHNAEINRLPMNPWSSEAYSIFQGNRTLQNISRSCFLHKDLFLFISKIFLNIFS